ncbi:hypothetical protein [Alkalimarinus sediminis]|uniref:Uncharacterized protein n=1 Tax=Alkalimarinus sediminis TaxID=1632866 RepID=A0A9E8HNW6_9ALTE|nr:hypothetical protein [Alkalimarinus sediminis]UZW76396.1 hypothetical protein NNL22_07355 [Alkalimarinus sediminis]
MDYTESLRGVLVRKINKAERDLQQLKLDYCRFVYGISHRSKVACGDSVYLVKAVDLDSMVRNEQGEWSKPQVSGVLLDSDLKPVGGDVIQIGQRWELVA